MDLAGRSKHSAGFSRIRSAAPDLIGLHQESPQINNADWVSIIEPLITFDALLREDPAESYSCMDFESRESYRKRIAFIARALRLQRDPGSSRRSSNLREKAPSIPATIRVSIAAISMSAITSLTRDFPNSPHGSAFTPRSLTACTQFIRATGRRLLHRQHRNHHGSLYSRGALSPFVEHSLSALAISRFAVAAARHAGRGRPGQQHGYCLLWPTAAAQTRLQQGHPPEYATMVAVPALLLNEEQVRKLVVDLEVRFLANRDPHLHFALLTDLPDSAKQTARQRLLTLLSNLPSNSSTNSMPGTPRPGCGSFLLLHRHRIFNVRQGVWMGWERKRGKLLDLNKLLVGEFDAFPIKAGRIEALGRIRYILTLDSDTQLPRGAAAQLSAPSRTR
jgi:cyclic beta-1,2-glucan synthetase